MTTIIRAKPITESFWIVEDNGVKVGVLKLNDQDKYVFSSNATVQTYDNKKKLIAQFGKDFFTYSVPELIDQPIKELTVSGFPTSVIPFNPMFDLKKKLPLFTKSKTSRAIYCAGYYVIKFEKGWVRSFCPKLVTLTENQYEGPFTTELEMKQRLIHVSKSN